MSKSYIDIPVFTTFKNIVDNDYTLSATQYKTLCLKNMNQKTVGDFLEYPLSRADLGKEVGSRNYIDSSNYKFIKTKALKEESFLINETNDSIKFIVPDSFVNMELKKGDVLISKDSNVGEVIILDKDYPNYMLCSGIYKLPIKEHKYYLLAFIKSKVFRDQIDFLVPKGSTIRHGKTKFLECKIPIPNKNTEEIMNYVELLTKAIINKEIEIRRKHNDILNAIEYELKENQTTDKFIYSLPSINEILALDRMDSRLYSKEFKENEFLITNYKNGSSTVYDLGFTFERANNLAVSVIGKSIYSKVPHKNFYSLILPKNISKYGTINKMEYLGNKSNLSKLNKGAIVFGAEGNGKGRSYVILDESINTITNYHGLTLYQENLDTEKSIFVKLFLDYLRNKGMIDAYAVGSNGGSLSIRYWDFLKFPNFPDNIKKKIIKLYYNPSAIYNISNCIQQEFLNYDNSFNKIAGIYELDKSMKELKSILYKTIDDISNDRDIKTVFKPRNGEVYSSIFKNEEETICADSKITYMENV